MLEMKKGATFSRNPLISLAYLAPRPGLEPGTYGLTVRKRVYFYSLISVDDLQKYLCKARIH
jgi:hypothetical protein